MACYVYVMACILETFFEETSKGSISEALFFKETLKGCILEMLF